MKVLDAAGKELRVGSVVLVDPDIQKPDRSMVTGFTKNWLGWRVEHRWLGGYHPDEPEPSERTELVEWDDGKATYRCPDLLRAKVGAL